MKSKLLKFKGMSLYLLCCISLLVTSKIVAQTPTISNFSPSHITQRTLVTINGSNFSGVTAVYFGGTNAASFTVVSATQIRAIVNTGTSGTVSVQNSHGTGTSSTTAIYTAPSGTASTAAVTRIISDFGGFWSSSAASSVFAQQPNSHHNLTAFRYDGILYSTKANDASLTANGISFTPAFFKALSTDGITGSTPSSAGNSNLIVLGNTIDGNATTALPSSPAVAGLTVRDVLIDGINGLDLGTGVTNLSSTSVMAYDVSNIVPSSLTDNAPDILITQIASPSAVVDVYSFVDSNGNIVGNPVGANLSAIPAVGTYRLDLFSLPTSTPYSTATPNGVWGTNDTRDIRLVAFRFADFGIDASNFSSIAKFKIMPGGDSDPAFIAYNAESFIIGAPTIVVNPIAQYICDLNPGPVKFSVIAVGPNLTYQWKKNNVSIPGATSPSYIISSPTAIDMGNYSVLVSNMYGSVIGTTTLTAGGGISEWNGTSWIGGTPGISVSILFSENYTSSSNLTGCNCIINPGVSVAILSDHTLKLQNEINVHPGGRFVLNNAASLVQVNEAALNNGIISMVRRTQPIRRFDYTYWSSAVSPQTLNDISPATLPDKYFEFDSALDNWRSISKQTQMEQGKGYIIRAPQNFSITASATYTATMTGIPNNGLIATPVVKGTTKANLLGNPYPSGLNADLFLNDPENVSVIGGTIYLWTHKTSPNASGQYTDGDYAKWNSTGSVKATSPNAQFPTGIIASGQAFFVQGAVGVGNGSAKFKNYMRAGAGNNNFFRNQNSSDTAQKHRLWLNLENTTETLSQILVGYVADATDNLDRAFDGKVFGDASSFLYSIAEDTQLAIQGRALPFEENDIVQLGYQTATAGNLKISLEQFEGVFANQAVYLRDKLLRVDHDLKATPYTFATLEGTFDNRFEIVYASENLGIKDPIAVAASVLIYKKDKNIVVNSASLQLNALQIFDIQGRLLYEATNINSSEKVITSLLAAQQVLIVQVTINDGQKISKKIIF